MRTHQKMLFGIGVFIVGFIVLFTVLLRGCLAKYDERSTLLPALYFEENGKPLLFSIVQFSKAISYSQSGGFVRKSMRTSYHIQVNDGISGARRASKKIKDHDDIRNYPVEILGASKGKAWLFIGELMAFDPITLARVADIGILEQKNPSLSGKFPVESRYYTFNTADSTVYFTATDGGKWKIRPNDLSILPVENVDVIDELEKEIARIEQLEKTNQADQDSNYQQRNRRISQLYSQQKITREQYAQGISGYIKVRETLYKVSDSLSHLKRDVEKKMRKKEDISSSIGNLQRVGLGYTSLKTNCDTMDGKWYGIYDETEFKKLNDNFRYSGENDETARRKLFCTTLGENKSGDAIIEKNTATIRGTQVLLHGGFLLDKKTALPVRVNNNSWVVIYKDQIGRDGKIFIACLEPDGNMRWSINTQLPEWRDWIYAGNRLFVFGKDNTRLTGSNCNVLCCIDLEKGAVSRYDYFADK